MDQEVEPPPHAEMSELFLDTHVTLWLFTGDAKRLSKPARSAIEGSDLAVSPAVKLELAFLVEVGRVRDRPEHILQDLAERIGLVVRTDEFARVVDEALAIGWSRDAFDRLIVAHAALHGAKLVTRDRTIREHYPRAVW
jgi:PIN domain nuclease of toxin-antitoxin system